MTGWAVTGMYHPRCIATTDPVVYQGMYVIPTAVSCAGYKVCIVSNSSYLSALNSYPVVLHCVFLCVVLSEACASRLGCTVCCLG